MKTIKVTYIEINRLHSIKCLIMLCLFVVMNVNADSCKDVYCGFVSVGTGYIIRQPDKIFINNYDGDGTKHKIKVHLYGDSAINYTIETGIKVHVDNHSLIIGLSWYDLLNQDESREINRPYILQPFVSYQLDRNDWFAYVGAGYKLFSDDRIKDKSINDGYLDYNFHPITDNITARFGIGYNVTNTLSIELEHGSQWLKGKPFNSDWEYCHTSLMIKYTY